MLRREDAVVDVSALRRFGAAGRPRAGAGPTWRGSAACLSITAGGRLEIAAPVLKFGASTLGEETSWPPRKT